MRVSLCLVVTCVLAVTTAHVINLDDYQDEATDLAAERRAVLEPHATANAQAARTAQPANGFTLPVTAEGYIVVKDRDPARILKALYNAAAPRGLGFIHANNEKMTTAEATNYIAEHGMYWDYVKGRPLKTGFDPQAGIVAPWGFDRDNGGKGTCKRVLEVEFAV